MLRATPLPLLTLLIACAHQSGGDEPANAAAEEAAALIEASDVTPPPPETEGEVGPAPEADGASPEEVEPPWPADRADEAQVITGVIQQHRSEISNCYAVRLASDSALTGRIDVNFNISAGAVTAAHITQNTTGDDALGECVVERIRTWVFPETIDTEVNYPFTLNSNLGAGSTFPR